ncbi:MAG TPA: hypothetical protein VG942_10035 [Hyphomonadaceae bacterium]|nr:hypothetical protein [Hyphomonadaceae bacterium]
MTDPIIADIQAAAATSFTGDRVLARAQLESVWSRIAANAHPMHECALSHAMADMQDDPADELAWDLRALAAALRCTDADVQTHSPLSTIAAFMPSLHTNLAEDYFKLGDFTRSRDHLATARSFLGDLPDDPYGRMIRRGIERLALKLGSAAA